MGDGGSAALAPSSAAESATVGEAVARAREILEGAGVSDARREAEELYAALVGRGASAAWLERERPMPVGVVGALEGAARRRAAGWPQAYACGSADFRGHRLAVDRRVLIPRPETEGLVDLVIEWARQERARCAGPLVVADVGTGSGAIALALALEDPGLQLVACDRSEAALEMARFNVEASGVGDRVELRHGHLVEPLEGLRVDAVVSNPPYVATAEWESLEPGVRDFEPREALDGGPDGLVLTRELVAGARKAVRAGGLLALEVDARRARRTAGLVVAAGFDRCDVIQDLSGRPRYVRARRPAHGTD
jgi:release factor glutamine methyltransferase